MVSNQLLETLKFFYLVKSIFHGKLFKNLKLDKEINILVKELELQFIFYISLLNYIIAILYNLSTLKPWILRYFNGSQGVYNYFIICISLLQKMFKNYGHSFKPKHLIVSCHKPKHSNNNKKSHFILLYD